VGIGALDEVQTGAGGNVAMGSLTMTNNTTGWDNVAVGDQALWVNTTGYSNTALGDRVLMAHTTGYDNVGVGKFAMSDNTTGFDNVAVGNEALYSNITGSGNSAVGKSALWDLDSGSENTALGQFALDLLVTGSRNVAIGSEAGSHFVLTSGSDNTFLGAYSGPASGYTTLNFATAIGAYAEVATENTIVLGRTIDNTVIGNIGDDGSGNKLQVSGSVGVSGTLSASRLNVGNYDGGVADINFAIGYEALAAAQSGDGGNMAIGEHTLEYNTTGAFNTAIGNYAMHWNETGINNTAVGYNALQDNVSGSNNTALGWHSMYFNTTGSSNTAVGDDAMALNSAGNLNVAVGRYALYSNGTTGIGFENTAVGYDAMERLTDGAENTSLGSFALNFLTTGSRNTVIGSEAASRDVAYYLTSGSDNSFLGAYSGPASGFNTLNFATAIGAYAQVSTNNTVVLGRTSDTVVIGATGNDASGNKLQVTGSIKATAFNTSSDRRLKNSITQLDSSNLLAQLQQLNAYHYRFNSDPTGQIRYGVIAQEVATLFPHAVSYDGQGLMAVDYGALGAIAATAVGQLSTQVTALDKQVKTNTENITTLTDRMGKAEGKIDALESWKTQAVDRMDNLQTAIDKNIADIAKNAVAITANTQRIDTLEEVTALLDARTTEHGSLIAVLQAQWSDTFSRADDSQTLVVNAPNLKASNFSAQQASVGTLYSERLMAEMAKIKALEVDSLLVNTAQARTVRAEEMNTGSAQVYAGVGLPALLFAATADGHYTVNTSALDGSYATATVIVNAGQAKIVPVASEGIELVAEGNTVKAIAAGKSIKASWIKMG
jgi:trimeric autotransporter adhesin